MKKLLNHVRHFLAEVRFSLCRLNRIQFDAPWAPRSSRCR